MAAPKNNQFWQLRSKHGRDKLFETPELLYEAASEYFNWCVKNPWYKVEQLKIPTKGFVDDKGKFHAPKTTIKIPTARPFTMQGLYSYLGCNAGYFSDFKKSVTEDSKGFSEIIHAIEQTIYQQKFEGAAVGVFNANIIARDLGLRENMDTTLKNPTGETFNVTLNINPT